MNDHVHPQDVAAAIREAFPATRLGEFPTPVESLPGLLVDSSIPLWVKRDDRASTTYGGNKVRKLELLLEEGRRRGARRLVTFGGVGSNHAVACAAHASRVGIDCEAIVLPQPLTPGVRRNLLLGTHFGARLHYAKSLARVPGLVLKTRAAGKRADGVAPYLVPPGGSNALGTLGYVLGALELCQQVRDGALPEPDVIYVPVGSGGTLAGLIVGGALVGSRSRLVGVQVVNPWLAGRRLIARLLRGTFSLLARRVPFLRVPPRRWHPPWELTSDYFGEAYGWPTRPAVEAVDAAARAGLPLETTYSGKTLAAVRDRVDRDGGSAGTLLFWDTYNSVEFSSHLEGVDWHTLPGELHAYFDGTIPLAKADSRP